ncbi:MAG: UDP-2,4-diacetamido-2,4,6-trideoxy-beta-L-altropyranose hydrolase [Phycisphaerae bacterium]|nr:UDP-2,4-diacetamido-2,4,6-trideoxy-beta-L-altropyranose hydrolase [Phycisphaerae bacterium]
MSEGVLIIRADASASVGTGHVMRCLALAQAWQAGGGRVVLASAKCPEGLSQRIEASGVSFVSLESAHPDAADLESTLALQKQHDSRWLVVDGYHFDLVFQRAIRSAGFRLMVIDDYAHLSAYEADILLNQNIGADKLIYAVNREAIRLLGPRYALLRPEFLSARSLERVVPEQAGNILVTMGGSDHPNVTARVLRAIRSLDFPGLTARIVVGPASPHRVELECLAAEPGAVRVDLLHDVRDMPGLMAWADLAVTAGGSTCWELAFRGVPMLVAVLAENQRAIAAGLEEKSAGINLGEERSLHPEDIAGHIQSLAADAARRRRMSAAGRALVDGRGTARVVGKMLELQPAGRN